LWFLGLNFLHLLATISQYFWASIEELSQNKSESRYIP
jgi:hypothetical protein